MHHARYDQLLKTSHAFNILDSRGFVGVTERARYFGRMRRCGYSFGLCPEKYCCSHSSAMSTYKYEVKMVLIQYSEKLRLQACLPLKIVLVCEHKKRRRVIYV